MKRLIIEIIVIVLFSIIMALVFNALDPEGLDIFSEPQKEETVGDDELFGNNNAPNKKPDKANDLPEKNKPDNEIKNSNNIKDTVRKDSASESEEGELLDVADNNTKTTLQNENTNLKESEWKTVNYEQMQRIASDESFIIIDARSPELYQESRIGNAINIFPFADNQETIIEKIFELPYGKKIVVYCDGGNCDASHKVAEMLHQFDFKNVYLYTGGWEEWQMKRNQNE